MIQFRVLRDSLRTETENARACYEFQHLGSFLPAHQLYYHNLMLLVLKRTQHSLATILSTRNKLDFPL